MSKQSQWLRVVLAIAADANGQVKYTRSGHLAIHLPNGVVVYTAGTPNQPGRETKNTRAAVKRALLHGRVK